MEFALSLMLANLIMESFEFTTCTLKPTVQTSYIDDTFVWSCHFKEFDANLPALEQPYKLHRHADQ